MSEGKWFARLDVWAFVVALGAMVGTTLSWVEMRQQLALYRGQVRAYVQVVDAELVEPITEASYIKLKLRLRNSGQTAATGIVGEMDYRVGMPGTGKRGNSATQLTVAPMGPGLERSVVLTSNRINRHDWPTPHARQHAVYFYGTVWYRDDTTNDQRKEDYCYRLPLTKATALTTTTIEPCGILQYQSEAATPDES